MADKAEKKRKVLTPDTKSKPEDVERVTFVVRHGSTFGINRLGAGSEVDLTVEEALPFGDLLEPKDRGTVLPSAATPQELADLGVEQVQFPSSETTDRDVMTPEQRASTSQVNTETGQGGAPTAEPPAKATTSKSSSKEK